MDYNTNIETDLSLTNFNFQFVSTRAPRAGNGNGCTEQFFRFRDNDNFPILIIKASRDFIDKIFNPKLLEEFVKSVSETEDTYEDISEGWVKENRNADLKKHSYSFKGYRMTVYYDASKNIKQVKKEALEKTTKM